MSRRQPTIKDARTAYNALRRVDTADHTAPDGTLMKGTYAFKGNVRLKMAARRLLDKLERIQETTQEALADKQIAIDTAKTLGEQRDAMKELDKALNEELDEETFNEVDPQKFGLRTSAMGLKIIDRVDTTTWKDLGPWFVEDVPEEELTEEGTAANRAERRSGS